MIDGLSIFQVVTVAIKVLGGITLLVALHELGHFMAAKKAGVWVEEFGIGIPPRIWGKKIGETLYSINLFPLGGFVRLHGETTDQKTSQPERSFVNKSKQARVGITLAGVFMNFVLAVSAFAVFYSFRGFPQETENVRILEVDSGSPAETAGFLIDDVLEEVDGQELKSIPDFTGYVNTNKGKEVEVLVERKEEDKIITKALKVTPREDHLESEGPLGVVITTTEIYFPPIWQRPFLGAYRGLDDTLFLSKAIGGAFLGIAGDVSQGQAPKGVVGPVGIFALLAYVASLGIFPFINIIGIFSVNLALFNLVPFPPLDGSRVLFIGLEAIFGRKILPRVESMAHAIGMILLLLLLLSVSYKEVPKFLQADSLEGFIESIVPTE